MLHIFSFSFLIVVIICFFLFHFHLINHSKPFPLFFWIEILLLHPISHSLFISCFPPHPLFFVNLSAYFWHPLSFASKNGCYISALSPSRSILSTSPGKSWLSVYPGITHDYFINPLHFFVHRNGLLGLLVMLFTSLFPLVLSTVEFWWCDHNPFWLGKCTIHLSKGTPHFSAGRQGIIHLASSNGDSWISILIDGIFVSILISIWLTLMMVCAPTPCSYAWCQHLAFCLGGTPHRRFSIA